jgi:hypothetical protein
MSSTDIGDLFDYDIADNRVRFASEDLPPRFLVGTYLEVNEMRYEGVDSPV